MAVVMQFFMVARGRTAAAQGQPGDPVYAQLQRDTLSSVFMFLFRCAKQVRLRLELHRIDCVVIWKGCMIALAVCGV